MHDGAGEREWVKKMVSCSGRDKMGEEDGENGERM